MLAVINRPVVSLYGEPGGETLTDEALYGTVCRILERRGEWARIRTHHGYEGYAACGGLLPGAGEDWLKSRLCAAEPRFLDVLAAPDVHAPRLLCLPAGALLSVTEAPAAEGWRTVRLADGRTGYVPEKHLAEKRFGEERLFSDREFSFSGLLHRHYGGSEAAFRRRLAGEAERYLGVQYRWGGRSAFGVDCSGLVSLAYMRAGVLIYRDARMAAGYPVRRLPPGERLRPGDLLYFPGHVAMYLGGGRYIHATARTGDNGVVYGSLTSGAPGYRADLMQSMYAAGGVRQEGQLS